MKAYTCGARAIFVESPENCPLLKNGNCEDGRACDAVEVVVTPKADHAKTQAALAAADKVLAEFELRVGRRSITFDEIKAARELIREAKGAEDAG